jgi:ABC-2 type transport system ATP-binding protein
MSISAVNITKKYGNRLVLDDVSIHCKKGEICGLLGANGAGKTTLFKVILGLITPHKGSVIVEGENKKKIGAIIEGPALYEYLSAHDNIKVFCKAQNMPVSSTIIHTTLEKVGLPINRKDPVRNFSLGMKQRLGIAIALLNNPSCLILDEPFSGLDPMGVMALRSLIIDLAKKENLAIILSSHIIEELSKLCTTLYVIKDGQIIRQGNAQKIITENTDEYAICAEHIEQSSSLQAYPYRITGQCAHVTISAEEIPILIKKLQEENILISACTPELNMRKLFNLAAS